MFIPSNFIAWHQFFMVKLPCGVRLLQASQSAYLYILQTTLVAVARKPTGDAIQGNTSARHHGHMSTSLRHWHIYMYSIMFICKYKSICVCKTTQYVWIQIYTYKYTDMSTKINVYIYISIQIASICYTLCVFQHAWSVDFPRPLRMKLWQHCT